MVRTLKIFIFCTALVGANFATAQSYDVPNTERSVGPRRQVATIVFAGLAGAILGLSTLSFYGRPQEKMLNIAYGAAVGIIVGASYTTYKAATVTRRPYEETWNERASAPEAWLVTESHPATSGDRWRVGTGWQWSF